MQCFLTVHGLGNYPRNKHRELTRERGDIHVLFSTPQVKFHLWRRNKTHNCDEHWGRAKTLQKVTTNNSATIRVFSWMDAAENSL
jgi:hypothetical protein